MSELDLNVYKKYVKEVSSVRKCDDDVQGTKAYLFVGGDTPPLREH